MHTLNRTQPLYEIGDIVTCHAVGRHLTRLHIRVVDDVILHNPTVCGRAVKQDCPWIPSWAWVKNDPDFCPKCKSWHRRRLRNKVERANRMREEQAQHAS